MLILALRLALAAVFCAAAVGKLVDPEALRALVERYSLPKAARLLPAVELALACALVVPPSARAAGAASAALLIVFSVFVLRDRHSSEGCGCFGRLDAGATAAPVLVRNGLLAAASIVLAASPRTPLAALGLALVAAAGASTLLSRARTHPPAVGERLLLFLDPDCGHCRALLPALRTWAGGAALEVVTRGAVDRGFARQLPRSALLVVDDGDIANRYGVSGRPAAVVLSTEGNVRRTVAGAAAVGALLDGALDDDRRRLEKLSGARITLDRRRVLALGAGSAVALALPGTSLGSGLTTGLTGHAGVECPSCGDCIICDAVGSPPKVTCRPCKQKCSTRDLCANYANKLPAYLQLASYLQSKGYAQSHDSVAHGLQQNGKLAVFGTSTEFTSSSTQTPRAVLFYSLTNSGGDAWAAIMDGKKHVVSVAVVGSGGQVTQATVPPVKLTKRRVAAVDAGYTCSEACTYVAQVSLALLEAGVALATGPEDVGLDFAKALFSASKSLATPSPSTPPSAVDSYAQSVYDAIRAVSTLDYIVDEMRSAAIDALCNQFVCTYALQACCSYGGCYDSLTACAKSCPESLKYQAPCLVYLTGHGLHTYLGRF